MSDEEVLNLINKSFKKIFKDKNLIININTKADDIEKWDSLNHIKIIIELQKKLGIKINSSDIHKFSSVKDFIKLKSKQSEKKNIKK